MKTLIVAAFALAGTLAASPSHAATLAGTYDGHCDGFSLTLNAAGAAYGSETGCVAGAIAGAKIKGGAVVNEPHLANTVYKINSKNHTWIIYQTSGAILQQGTWTPVAAGAAPRELSGQHPTGTR